VRTFAILTTVANRTMHPLHVRMPVILEPDAWSLWLGEDRDRAAELLRPAGDEVLHLWPVSRAVNSVRNNGAELLDRIDDPNAPPPSDAPAGLNPA
jgi:putative SOS response-associated peptidase YedK